ncbi:DUF4038 domain-containing protein [Patescibacteria group bacterium]
MYFQNRRLKKFNAAYVGLVNPWDNNSVNANGDYPFLQNNCLNWNEAYFAYTKKTIEKAAAYDGMGVNGRYDFALGTTDLARQWGQKIGSYFKDYDNIIYALGSDRDADLDGVGLHRAVAEGIGQGETGQPLGWNQQNSAWDQVMITYHPGGGLNNSSFWFHTDPWLDFNSIQLYSDTQQTYIYSEIREDYNKTPIKPTWIIESAYETRTSSERGGVPDGDPIIDDYWVRYAAYTSVFAGAFGASYGHHHNYYFPSDWQSKLDTVGADDMAHLYSLLTNRQLPFEKLEANQELITSPIGTKFETRTALLAEDGSFAYVYLPRGGEVTLDLALLSSASNKVLAQWFNPREGTTADIDTYSVDGEKTFHAPGSYRKRNDYLLILRDENGLLPISYLDGDVNRDGQINQVDGKMVLENYGQEFSNWPGNFFEPDGNSYVNGFDFGYVVKDWSKV